MSPAKSKLFYLITKGSPFGGAQSYVLDLASSLPKDRFEPAVIMGEGGELEKKLRAENIVSYQLPSLGRDIGWQSDWKAFWALVKFLKKERPDIIHLNSSKAGFLGALAARLAHVPKIIFTAHNWAFNENRPWWQKASFRFAHWLTIILCHEVITVSEKTGSQVANWPGIKGKIHLIHNGLRPIDFLSRSEARAELAKKIWKKGFDPEILDRTTIIGTISELHKNKGLDFLLTAVSELKPRLEQTLVWIIGGGEENEHFLSEIKRLGLKGQVTLLGKIDNAKKYLRAFDIFTLTSRTEAFPYALLEAGQAGLPVIASAVGGIPEIVSDFNQGILIRPGNIRELKLALARLINQPSERIKFGDNLAKKVNRDFTLDKMVRETVKLYEDKL